MLVMMRIYCYYGRRENLPPPRTLREFTTLFDVARIYNRLDVASIFYNCENFYNSGRCEHFLQFWTLQASSTILDVSLSSYSPKLTTWITATSINMHVNDSKSHMYYLPFVNCLQPLQIRDEVNWTFLIELKCECESCPNSIWDPDMNWHTVQDLILPLTP